jgi:hypothetical protein
LNRLDTLVKARELSERLEGLTLKEIESVLNWIRHLSAAQSKNVPIAYGNSFRQLEAEIMMTPDYPLEL